MLYVLIAGACVAVAALIAVALGAYHAFRNGSPRGAIALLLGVIVIAVLVGPIVLGQSFAPLGSSTP